MNLWSLFPEQLLAVPGILSLPYLALPIYFVLLLILIKTPTQALSLSLFILLSLLTSVAMLLSMGPSIGTVLLPLLLLAVIVMPVSKLIYAIYCKNSVAVRVWIVASIAGLLHSLSWSLWLFALAGS